MNTEDIKSYENRINHLESYIKELEDIIQSTNLTDTLYEMNYRKLTFGLIHDLKHSLYGISMNLQFLDDKITLNNENRKIQDCWSEIQKQSLYVSFLSDTFTKKKIEQVIDVNDIIRQTGKFILQKYNISFELIQDSDIPGILLDRAMFSMAIFNLLNNAVEAIRERRNYREVKGLICIKTFYNKKNIIISIEDNGQGIKKEVMYMVFDLGFTTKRYEGTGMGLYFVRSCVEELWEGKIEVKSTHGKGAIFTIEIPVNRNFK